MRVAAPQPQPPPSRASRSAPCRAPDKLAAAARRPGARRLGRAPAPGAFALDEAHLLRLWSLFLLPAGCERAAADAAGAQLVAKVNGTEISVHQCAAGAAAQRRRAGAGAGEGHRPRAAGAEGARRRASTATRRCAVDRERAPPGAGAGLAGAQRAGRQHGSTRDEVRAFYAENPALFAERRIYRLRELVVSAPAELIDVLRAEARQGARPRRGRRLAARAQREVQRRRR